jgi:hypothetical protein
MIYSQIHRSGVFKGGAHAGLSNPVLSISNFAYPAPFTPGNAGRNIDARAMLQASQKVLG